MAKIRSGFVSNSSSSSFIAVLNRNGRFEAEGMGTVYAVVGLGFTAYSEDYIHKDTENFSIGHDDDTSDNHSFIRPFSQMKPEQTLSEFTLETCVLFATETSHFPLRHIEGPKILAAGSVGNGG